MTILLYVRRKGWPLKSVTVECSYKRDYRRDLEDSSEGGQAYIEVVRQNILVEGPLTAEQKERVGRIASRCPVHRTLESSLRMEDDLEVVG